MKMKKTISFVLIAIFFFTSSPAQAWNYVNILGNKEPVIGKPVTGTVKIRESIAQREGLPPLTFSSASDEEVVIHFESGRTTSGPLPIVTLKLGKTMVFRLVPEEPALRIKLISTDMEKATATFEITAFWP